MNQLLLWPGCIKPTRIIFHADFDGACAAALLSSFFQTSLVYEPVNYSAKRSWLRRRLETSAVVDFLYHPEALWWFDHHETTFISEDIKKKYSADEQHRWDISYPSCPSLILDVLGESMDVSSLRRTFSEWAEWSDIIDAARYATPFQAVLGEEPCILINQALAQTPSLELRTLLVERIANGASPSELANEDIFASQWHVFRKSQSSALQVIKDKVSIIESIGYCDLTESVVPFIRYGLYLFAPQIHYSVVSYNFRQGKKRYRVSLGRNPWHRSVPNGVNLGCLAQEYGGGGRQDVASIPFATATECREAAVRIAQQLAAIENRSQYEEVSK